MSTSLLATVGSTPLVALRGVGEPEGVRLFAKLEGNNPSGSVKDRIAVAMVDEAERSGRLKPGDTLVEATTGNTGIALAMVARQRGYRLVAVVPDGVVPTIGDLLALGGVEVVAAPARAGMMGAIQTMRRLADEHGWIALAQFENPANLAAHRVTGDEILAQCPEVDVFVAGIGTGGTLMGAGRRLREGRPGVDLVAVEPRMGEHLQGLRSMDEAHRPPFVDLDLLDARYLVSSATALQRCQAIYQATGVLAGVSGGACLQGALRYAERRGPCSMVIMVADGGWKYLPAHPWHAAAEGDTDLDEMHWW